jgi:hypothetical protein
MRRRQIEAGRTPEIRTLPRGFRLPIVTSAICNIVRIAPAGDIVLATAVMCETIGFAESRRKLHAWRRSDLTQLCWALDRRPIACFRKESAYIFVRR